MLSKSELEYLKNPSSFNESYGKVLRHRINSKARALEGERQLLENAGIVTENCNQVTKFSNPKNNPKQALSMNQGQNWSLRRDLDPRPLPYQARTALTS